MNRTHIYLPALLAALSLTLCLALPVHAADGITGEEEYVFTGEEFLNAEGESPSGVFVTGLPADRTARLLLGDRIIRAGDAIAGADLSRLRLCPTANRSGEAAVSFLPVYADGAEPEAVFTLHIQKAENRPPIAKDLTLETYRNLPNTACLQAENDDGAVRFALQNAPSRGTVELSADGSFTYTPRRNKVGEDSFTFTATDAAGQVSAPATVHIRILLPQDAETFADLPREGQFSAIWLREQNLYGGERVAGRLSFGPGKPVSRGEFLAMVMDLRQIPPEIGIPASDFADASEAPAWLRPYLASALRRGLIRGVHGENGLCFCPNEPITCADASLIVSRALGLPEAQPAAALSDESMPAWAAPAVEALRALDLPVSGSTDSLTRQQAAELLYALSVRG